MYGGSQQTVLWWNKIQSLNETTRCQCKACYKACKEQLFSLEWPLWRHLLIATTPTSDTTLCHLKRQTHSLRKILSLHKSRNSASLTRRDLAWRLGVRNLKHLMHPLMVWETPRTTTALFQGFTLPSFTNCSFSWQSCLRKPSLGPISLFCRTVTKADLTSMFWRSMR